MRLTITKEIYKLGEYSMINKLKAGLLDFIADIKGEIEDSGSIWLIMGAFVLTLIALPLCVVYILLLKPIYKTIRMLFETPILGIRKAFMKYFLSDKYKEEQRDKAFERKKALDSLLLPDSKWKKFDEWENWPDAYVIDKIAIYANEGRTLVYVDERVTDFNIPKEVENIYCRCFAYCHKLKHVVFPQTLKRIGEKAFYECVSLEEITIPESVYILDKEIFKNCTSLKHVVLPKQTTEIPSKMFENCRTLAAFRLPESVKVIYNEAFRNCLSLNQVDTNNQLEVIQEKAFENCISLRKFIMPETVRYVESGFLNGCHSLLHIHLSSQIKDFGGSFCEECWSINKISMPVDEKMKSYAKEKWAEFGDKIDISISENPIPESMFWMKDNALYFGIPRLTSVCLMLCFTKEEEFLIPSFVTNIKEMAFSSCKELRSLRMSSDIIASADPWGMNKVTYSFIYEHWPQVEHIVFDDSLKHTKYAFGLIG